MEDISQYQTTMMNSQEKVKMLVNGEDEEFEKFIETTIGIHYLKKFDEKKIRKKEELDKRIDEMLTKGKGIVLLGGTGVGKTMDLVYIAKRIIEVQKRPTSMLVDPASEKPYGVLKGKLPIPIAYFFMPKLFDDLHYGQAVEPKQFNMLDDWGREYVEPFSLSRFEIFIEEAYSKELTLIITTNLTKRQFINREGWGRIIDRVREMCNILEIPGNSMRHK